jgi:hypothetical protein
LQGKEFGFCAVTLGLAIPSCACAGTAISANATKPAQVSLLRHGVAWDFRSDAVVMMDLLATSQLSDGCAKALI